MAHITKRLLTRYRNACNFESPIDHDRIRTALQEWSKVCFGTILEVKLLNSFHQAERDKHEVSTQNIPGWVDSEKVKFHEARTNTVESVIMVWITQTQIRRQVSDFFRHFYIVSNLAASALSAKDAPGQKLLLEALEHGAMFLSISEGVIYIVTRPQVVHVDEQNRLHCNDDAAIRWGARLFYYWHGAEVPGRVIENPLERVAVRDIDGEPNLEVRRVMIERYGTDRFIRDSDSLVLDNVVFRERNYVLYWTHNSPDEAIAMLKVTNATAEADGTFKDYWIRVPPNMNNAWKALAWTFNMSEQTYRKLVFES